MRILHLTDFYLPVLGGIETHVAALAREQARAGHEVTVATTTPAAADGQTAADDGPVRVRRQRWVGDGFGVDPAAFDVVHAHVSVLSTFAAPLAASAARRGCPTVVTVHSLWDGVGPVSTVLAGLTTLRRAPVTWTAVSEVAATQVARRLPRGARVHVLPNAVAVPARAATPVPGPGDPVSLVSSMRLAYRKRPVTLVDVFAELVRSTDVPLRLTLVGDGWLRPAVERRVRAHGLRGQVDITGRVAPAAVLDHLAGADVYVAPATLESFGLAALEARCVGLPVVGRSGTGLAEFVTPGVHGMLCGSDRDLVRGLQELVEDAPLRHRIAEHNRLTTSEMTWPHTMRRHDAVYAVATGRRQAAAALSTVTGRVAP